MIHRSMPIGIFLFALVVAFIIRPRGAEARSLQTPQLVLLGSALVFCAVGLFLSTRVPRRLPGESDESFWLRAVTPALISWAPLEGAGLAGIVVYSQTGSLTGVAVAAVAVSIFLLLNPGYFEKR